VENLSSEDIEFAKTGVSGIDQMLEGKGIPRGYTVILAGGPGSGKTILSIHFLHNGVTQFDEPGVYVSVDENPVFVKRNMAKLGFDLERLQKQGKFAILDVSPIRYVKGRVAGERSSTTFRVGKKDFSLLDFRRELSRIMEEIDARRVVIDPITILMLQHAEEAERRYAMIDLIQALAVTGATTLLVSELRGTALEREHQFEEYLAQGVILLRTQVLRGELIKTLQVEKMRGVDHDSQPRPYNITSSGLEVYPSERVL
jgi:KaiC/GvpD/RAD55 family RecA-like ATPase